MKAEIRQRWVEALRSGQYQQGTSRLATVEEDGVKYCCLGVLCDISPVKGRQLDGGSATGDDVTMITFEGDGHLLPGSVREWAGIETQTGNLSAEDLPESLRLRADEHVYVTVSGRRETALSSLNDNGFSFEEIATIIENCEVQ